MNLRLERYGSGGAAELQIASEIRPRVRFVRNGRMLGLEVWAGNWLWASLAIYRPPWTLE